MTRSTAVTRSATRHTSLKENRQDEPIRPRRNTRSRRIIDSCSSDSDCEIVEFKMPVTPSKKKSPSPPAEEVTPIKVKKVDENQTSPSTLLTKLTIVSPRPQGKRELFPRNHKYQTARKALHSTTPSSLPGREKEIKELEDFIKEHLLNQSSGTLYISGPPGTGKTASLSLILQKEEVSKKFVVVYVNCTAIKSSGSIYSKIVKELGLKSKGRTEKDYLAAVETFLKKPHEMILLVLDEIDQLDSKNQSVLYTIFEWPALLDSKLVLIGIANALDLTDRILPRLQARCELKPKLMHFASYTKQQLMDIFSSRLREAGVQEVFSPVALQLLSGKVAAVSGDVRRALDIGRRVIELGEQKNTTLKPVENIEKCTGNASVEVKHVMDVLSNVYGAAQNLSDDADDSFPLQQKITVCSLLLMLKKAKNKDVTLGKLHEVYRRVCAKRNLSAVDQGEFVSLCSLLETRGIVKVVGKKEPRLSKVSLEWDQEEVAEALKDKQLMSTILHDESCLGRL